MASFILLESSRLRLSKEKLTPDEIVRRKEMALFSAIEKQRKFANHSLELGGVSIRGSTFPRQQSSSVRITGGVGRSHNSCLGSLEILCCRMLGMLRTKTKLSFTVIRDARMKRSLAAPRPLADAWNAWSCQEYCEPFNIAHKVE